MNSLELTTLINFTANIIAKNACADEIDLLSSIFSQLGDTLATINVQNELLENHNNKIAEKL